MSDHWNGLANLLGTPSLNPVSKKTDSPAKPAATPAPATPQSAEPSSLATENTKTKSEPSRLRSSWDAVAQFFGVASPEPSNSENLISETPTASSPKEQTAGKSARNDTKPQVSARKKQSMWDSEPEDEPAASTSERSIQDEPSQRLPSAKSENDVIEIEGFSKRPERGQRDRTRETQRTEKRTPDSSDPTLESRESRDPDRRSQRRPPRRGRVEGAELSRTDLPEENLEPRDDSRNSDAPRAREDSRERNTPRSDSPRERRPSRDDRPRDAKSSEHAASNRQEPARGEREPAARSSESRGRNDRSRAERPPREERPREDRIREDRIREDRPPREEIARDDRGRAGRGRDASSRETPGRETPGRDDRGRSRSEPRGTDVRKEVERNQSKNSIRSGFGAGIDDEPAFIDDEDSVLEHDFEAVESDLDQEDAPIRSESDEEPSKKGRPRRRRGRGRGRKDEASDSPSAVRDREPDDQRHDDDHLDNDVEESGRRQTRIPSWQEAIGTLVAVNMENHQRSQGQGRNNRGRGPRRDR